MPASRQNYGSGHYKKYKGGYRGMAPKRKALRKFFRKGLATLGEKKIFQKNYAVADLSVSTDATFQTYAWSKFQIPLEDITHGTSKSNRIGDKIYVRYVTWDVEVYGSTSEHNFPYIRVIMAKDRAANTVLNSDLPVTRLGKPNVNALSI